jgi:flavin reductase (DIM6/NTAB) family NADH-FMN oxidoreductase RutF
MFFEPGKHKEHGFTFDPFKATISPRPIGWISTLDENGVTNLAPYSFFNAVSWAPHCVIFSSGSGPDGSPKDSQMNAEKTGEFVCNIVGAAQAKQMNETAIHFPHGKDEMQHAGLEGLPSQYVKPLRVKDAPVHLECKYLRTIELPSASDTARNCIILGEVVGIHIDEKYVADGRLDVTKYQPVGRLGYMDYCAVSEVFEMNRPD